MTQQLELIILLHFHQPDYRHPTHGRPVLPWVRLHGVRGYSDILAALEESASARVTLNWTPVLVDQLIAAAAGTEDRWLELAGRPPGDLDAAERRDVIRFHSQASTAMIESIPRFAELVERARAAGFFGEGGEGGDPGALSDAQVRDLTVCFHLAWTGFRLRRSELWQGLRQRGSNYDDSALGELIELHRGELATLLPRARDLAAADRVALSTTPYAHPILPLLAHLDSHDFAHAGGDRNPFEFRYAGDALDHLHRAVRLHRDQFGAAPAGTWPSEGALSEMAVELLSEAGLKWAASDEELLWKSRDPRPERRELYRPYVRATASGDVRLYFRDHELSDRIGFAYQSWDAEEAAADFVATLDEIRNDAEGTPVVTVALDGENPWEYYPDAGEPFLRAWLHRLETTEWLTTTTPERVTAPATSLDRLATGSWIDGSLDTWAGHEQKLNGWRQLAAARATLGDVAIDQLDPELARNLRAAEGSDWFWWYGDDHPTELRDIFDQLFRGHLLQLYAHAGQPAPAELHQPIAGQAQPPRPVQMPRGIVSPRGDLADFLDWSGAGQFELQAGGGAMNAARSLAPALMFGADAAAFHVAVESSPQLRGLALELSGSGLLHLARRESSPWLRVCVPREQWPQSSYDLLELAIILSSSDGRWQRWPASGWAQLAVADLASSRGWV